MPKKRLSKVLTKRSPPSGGRANSPRRTQRARSPRAKRSRRSYRSSSTQGASVDATAEPIVCFRGRFPSVLSLNGYIELTRHDNLEEENSKHSMNWRNLEDVEWDELLDYFSKLPDMNVHRLEHGIKFTAFRNRAHTRKAVQTITTILGDAHSVNSSLEVISDTLENLTTNIHQVEGLNVHNVIVTNVSVPEKSFSVSLPDKLLNGIAFQEYLNKCNVEIDSIAVESAVFMPCMPQLPFNLQ